ncbi:MAG: MBL fold/beta-CASP domain-containing RNA metallo-hydrolase [Clostridiales bacterium]|jgi:metallo-beta-lactamase family protein|nr:rNA-metabolising metallo-beta-lactamase [Clostridium sp. CAG:567]
MKITFLGATKMVTGSNFLVEGAGKKFLVDCGMYQGGDRDEMQNHEPFAYDVNEIDFMLLTHAHIDHSGRIPKLYKEGYRNPVITTKATRDLCSIMLPDSGHIQEQEIEWRNRKRMREGKEALPPLYTAQDAIDTMEIFKPVNYDEIIEIDPNIYVRFNDAGHMLGSAIIEIWVKEDGKETKAVFTGDLGNNDIPLLSSPTMIDNCDYLVMESTYGGRLHIRNDEKANLFLNIVSETLDKGGTVVIPSFAVGRTQEILYELNNLKDAQDSEEFKKKYATLMKAPVYVDSPLAISATEVFRENANLFDEETQALIERGDNPLEFPGLQFTRTADESKALNEKNESAIIISASGMCEVGRIKHHLKHHLWDPNSTVLFVGYQAPGTLGRRIVDGEKVVRIFGEEIAVNARIEYIEGYSGHADQEWLMNFIYSFITKPKHVFLVHGEPNGQEILKAKIEEEAKLPVIIPEYGQTYTLDDNLTMEQTVAPIAIQSSAKREVLDKIKLLKNELNDMESIVREDYLSKKDNENEISLLKLRLKEIEDQIVKIVEKN